jgi:hypothetical protein
MNFLTFSKIAGIAFITLPFLAGMIALYAAK